MNKFTPLILLLLFSIFTSTAQYNNEFGSTEECYGKTFTVVAWVLTDTTNSIDPLTENQVRLAIQSVNSKFSGICVDFNLCEFNELPNHRQDPITRGIHDEEIAALYRKKNVINLYFASEIIDDEPNPGPCGYAPLGSTSIPSDTNKRDAIFLKKSCFTDGVLAHELGHYFGLYHTFETDANGEESPTGSDCATTGDLVCDTQADPDGTNDANCHLSPQIVDPASGLYYEPPVCNIMSYYTPDCAQYFTIGQLNRMLMIMKTGRSYLW